MPDKITLSFKDLSLKERLKEYAKEQGETVSAIVEHIMSNLVKSHENTNNKNNDLKGWDEFIGQVDFPNDFDINSATAKMYEQRAKKHSAHI